METQKRGITRIAYSNMRKDRMTSYRLTQGLSHFMQAASNLVSTQVDYILVGMIHRAKF